MTTTQQDPKETSPRPDPTSPGPGRSGPTAWLRALALRSSRGLGLILLTFVAWVLVRGMSSPYGFLSVDPSIVFAIALVAGGVLLLRGQQPVLEDAVAVVAAPKPRSPLGVLTISVAFLVVGTMILVGNLGAAEVTIGQMAAAGLFVVGLGLLVGAWWGRSRFLMVAGVVMMPFVVAGGFMPFPLQGSVGDLTVYADIIDDVEPRYEILAGALYMEMVDIPNFQGTRTVDISAAAGRVTILVPRRISLTIKGNIEYGRAAIGVGRLAGEDLVLANEIEGQPGAGHLVINFRGGIASLYVERINFAERYGFSRRELERRQERMEQREDRIERDQQRKERKAREIKQRERRRQDAKARD